jgi:hypothetical protein
MTFPPDKSVGAAEVESGRAHRQFPNRSHGRSAWIYGSLALAALAGLLVGFYAGYVTSDFPIAKPPDPPSMSRCVADTMSLFDQKNTSASESLREARNHCHSIIQSQQVLADLAIRKLNFFQQYRANGVLMWMVVLVTLSGVLLAGVQLRASYQLAAANKTSLPESNGELILKRDQLVLKSSITGLFILVVSFCFFLVFVMYVYRFEAVQDHDNSVLPPGPMLPMGGLGPPTPEKDKPPDR